MDLLTKCYFIQNDYFKVKHDTWARTFNEVYLNIKGDVWKYPIEKGSFIEGNTVFINSSSSGEPLILVLRLDNEITIAEFNEETHNVII